MSCAGCDDCPQDAWHLHVTVQPHWSWSLTDVASALQRDIERHDIKPVVVTNHFHNTPERSYRELIPTKNFKGTEAGASREIFRMGILLNNAGWRVKRLKIEGNPANIREGRALYYECHLKNTGLSPLAAPCSTNVKGDHIHTVRRETILDVEDVVYRLLIDMGHPHLPLPPLRIEAAVLDTNPDLDKEWINQ